MTIEWWDKRLERRRYVLVDEEEGLTSADLEMTDQETEAINTELRSCESGWRWFRWHEMSEAA